MEKYKYRASLLLVLLLTLSACGGGSSSTGSNGAAQTAPTSLSYLSPITATVELPLAPVSPAVSGSASTYGVSPALPTGLSLNVTTGVISGTPAVVQGRTDYTITASNAAGSTSFVVALAANPAVPSRLFYATPITVFVGQAMLPLTPTVTGIVDSYSISPALPPGVTLDSSSGVIMGTPTSSSQQQSYTITAANVTGNTTYALRLDALALTAKIGQDQTVELGSFVLLDGSMSSTSSGNPLIFHWTFNSMPTDSESTLVATSSPQPVFRADKLGTYSAALMVSDADYSSSLATVNITVVPKVAHVISPPSSNSIAVTSCQQITAPGDYELQVDLVATPATPYCLSIHDTNHVVLHCDGHHISDAPDYSARAIEVRNVQTFTVQDCLITTDSWDIADSSNVHLRDNQLSSLLNIANQASIWVWRTPKFTFEFNKVSDVALQLIGCDDAVVANNQFSITPTSLVVLPAHVNSQYGSNIQVLQNEFDGGWDGITLFTALTNAVDDAIVLKDATNALVRNNYIKNYWDAGIEWVGRLEGSLIQSNVIVNAGFAGIGGWAWSSVSNTRFVQNLADRSRDLFHTYRLYGLRPAGYDTNVSGLPADTGVYFRNNLFDGNVLRNQRHTTVTGTDSFNSSWILFFDHMGYGGAVSSIPGEVVPTEMQFDLKNNIFIRNDFGRSYPGPLFGTGLPTAGEVVDGGQNICVPIQRAGTNFPLACN